MSIEIKTKEFTFENKKYEITESNIFDHISASMFDASRNGCKRVKEIKGELLIEFKKHSNDFKDPILLQINC